MIKIYGQSDDLVIINGDLEEEYACYNEPCYIIFSDGTLVKAEYKNGQWTIQTEKIGKNTEVDYEPANDFEENYSDILTLNGDINWCIIDLRNVNEIRDHLRDNLNWDEVEEETLKELYIKYFKTKEKV
jgi:hypothetical protein